MIRYCTAEPENYSVLVRDWQDIFGVPMTMRTFLHVLICDENFDSQAVWLAMDDDVVAGFAISIRRRYPYIDRGLEEDRCWLLAIGVKPKYRRQGIGLVLLQKAMEYNRIERKQMILGMYSPLYFFPAVNADSEALSFFLSHGFEKQNMAFAMHRNLNDYKMPEKVLKHRNDFIDQGIVFRNMKYEDAPALLNMISDEFTTGWYRNVCQAISNGTAEDKIILAMDHSRPAGYIQRAYDGDPKRFGPFGVSKSFRNCGLGSVLLHLCWQQMRDEDLDTAYFKTTDEQAMRFYLKNGMTVDQKMYHMNGELKTCK
ncbi:MAG: GNAT family N-acetyltransferase [Erysipelotrichia bacterium]|nr:GNAT family N-acetyltransferase [Erysipelotrichia bacterium]